MRSRHLIRLQFAAAAATLLVGCGYTYYTGPLFVTGNPRHPVARVVAVDGQGRVAGLFDHIAEDHPVTELPGAVAVPGMHDAHLHVMGIGRSTSRANLLGATTPTEVVTRLKGFERQTAQEPVIRARGWDQSRFPDKRFPTAEDLASLGDERPVVLTRVDGHAAWVNRKALAMAGIDTNTPDPQGGKILRAADGTPTGVLIDNAINLVTDKLPKAGLDAQRRWYWAGLERCAADGLTGVHDMGVPVALMQAVVADVKAGRAPPVRLFIYLEGSADASLEYLKTHGPGPKELAPRVWLMGAKLYADGAMGSRGAALLADYSDAPGNKGHLLFKPQDLAARVKTVHDAGFQVAIHAIGDRGVRTALDAIEAAQKATPRDGPPHRLEHAQLVATADFARMKALNVVASMQPTHATSDMRWAEARVGPERIAGAYAWKRMLTEAVALAFGSDSPIESHKPTWGLYAAVTRQDHSGQPEGGWRKQDALTFDEAVHAFTRGAATAVGQKRLGWLEVGTRFDVTVFDVNVLRAPPKDWVTAKAISVVSGD